MLVFCFYLISVLSSIKDTLSVGLSVFFILLAIYSFIIGVSTGNVEEVIKVVIRVKKLIYWAAVLGVLVLFIPNKRTSYTMMAAYGVTLAAENPDIKKLAGNSLKLVNSQIEKYLKDTDHKEQRHAN